MRYVYDGAFVQCEIDVHVAGRCIVAGLPAVLRQVMFWVSKLPSALHTIHPDSHSAYIKIAALVHQGSYFQTLVCAWPSHLQEKLHYCLQEAACTAKNINSMLLRKWSLPGLLALECALKGTSHLVLLHVKYLMMSSCSLSVCQA